MRWRDFSLFWIQKNCVWTMELDDKPKWDEKKNNDFSIRAMYKVLEAEPNFLFI